MSIWFVNPLNYFIFQTNISTNKITLYLIKYNKKDFNYFIFQSQHFKITHFISNKEKNLKVYNSFYRHERKNNDKRGLEIFLSKLVMFVTDNDIQ